jgi:uncharacterized protein with HEPN domain
MRRDAPACLWDIDRAASAIERFTDGLDIRAYAQNELVHTAVERKLEIIGEAEVNYSFVIDAKCLRSKSSIFRFPPY